MRRRPWRGGLGLRGRIVGAVLVTTVATLAVAALALLGPLEHKLRDADLTTLKTEVTRTTPQSMGIATGSDDPEKVLDYGIYGVHTGKATGKVAEEGLRVRNVLLKTESALQQRYGAAEVAILGLFNSSGEGKPLVVSPPDSNIAQTDAYEDATMAVRQQEPIYTLGSIAGADYARAAIPFTFTAHTNGGGHWQEQFVLVVRKPLDDVTDAVAAVRTAFLDAALVAVALTLLLAIPLASRIVRRLRRLREAALQLATGDLAVDVPVDRARDEVGDLARTFANMQHRLQQQEEARRAFVATASHELRTPLTSLDGMLELLDDDLQSGDPDLDDARALLESARAQSRRLGRLAADLLDLSRLDAEVDLRSEPVELVELSRAVMAEFDLGADERRVQLELDDGGGQVWALGDPGSVARILRILLDNALRMSPLGGAVRVELSNGTKAALTVCDQGPGVPGDERELIFERFQRGRETAGKAGFGLGLAIGRELAERMGGELVLDCPDTVGSRFTLRLPVARATQVEPIPVA
jgi:signal transduction histidine kinase